MFYYLDENGNAQPGEINELMVRTAADFDTILQNFGNGIYQPGLYVYTPGNEVVKRLTADGTWENIVGGENDGE